MFRIKSILALFIIFSSELSSQNITNNSFENWQTKNKTVNIPFVGNQNAVFSDPNGWSSSNTYGATSTFGNKTLVFKDTANKMHLTASAKLKTTLFTILIQNFKVPGLLVLGDDLTLPFTSFGNYNLNNISGAGIPYTQKPKSFYGYLKNTIVGGDSVSCYAVLKNKGNVVATALYTTGSNNNSFTRFESDFKYVSCKSPDSMYIVLVTSSIGNIFANSNDTGTTMWVDSLGLDVPAGFIPVVPINTRTDSAIVKCNATISIDVLQNDDTCQQTGLTLSVIQQSSEGTATINGSSINFTKNGNAKTGFTSIRYKLCNAASECDSSFVYINIQPNYDAVNDRDTIRCETFKDIDVKLNDSKCIGAPDTIYIVAQSNKGNSTIVNNKLRFTKNPNATPGNTTVRYVFCNNNNTECDTANVLLNIVNSKIDAKDDTISTNCLDPVQIFILTNDVLACGGNYTNVSFITNPPSGTATLSLTNRVTFTPGLNSSGIIAFKYKVCEDVSGLCDTAEIRINLRGGNKLDAKDDSIYIDNTTATNIKIGLNDSINACFNTKTFSLVKTPTQGNAVVKNDTIVYTSNSPLIEENFTYRMCSVYGGNNYCDTATVKIGKPKTSQLKSWNEQIKILSNPFHDMITIQSEIELNNILIMDITGKIIIQEKAMGQSTRINADSFNKGIYILQVSDKNGNIYQEKLTKE